MLYFWKLRWEFLTTDPEIHVRFLALPEVVGLERGPLSLVGTVEELLERKIGGSGLENGDYGRRGLLRWPRDTPLSSKVDTNFADKRRSSISIVLSRAKATKFFSDIFKGGIR
jgi:hypothetical protein